MYNLLALFLHRKNDFDRRTMMDRETSFIII